MAEAHVIDRSVSIKHDFVLVVHIVELLLGNVDSSLGQEVDLKIGSEGTASGCRLIRLIDLNLPCPLVAGHRKSRLAH